MHQADRTRAIVKGEGHRRWAAGRTAGSDPARRRHDRRAPGDRRLPTAPAPRPPGPRRHGRRRRTAADPRVERPHPGHALRHRCRLPRPPVRVLAVRTMPPGRLGRPACGPATYWRPRQAPWRAGVCGRDERTGRQPDLERPTSPSRSRSRNRTPNPQPDRHDQKDPQQHKVIPACAYGALSPSRTTVAFSGRSGTYATVTCRLRPSSRASPLLEADPPPLPRLNSKTWCRREERSPTVVVVVLTSYEIRRQRPSARTPPLSALLIQAAG